MRLRVGAAMFLVISAILTVNVRATATAAGAPIKIGFLFPFQGNNAIFGTWAQVGINLRLHQVHSLFQGRQIQIFKANEDPTNPSTTLQNLKTLVQQDGVSVVIGPAFSSDEEAVAAYAKQANITVLILLTCPWDISKNGHFLCWPGTDVATTQALGAYAYDHLKYRRIDTIGPDYVAGHNYIGGTVDKFKSKGGKIVQQQWVPLTAVDVGPYLSKVNRNADAIVVWLLPSNEVAFLEQYKKQGLTMPILLQFDEQDPYNQQLGPTLNGTIGTDFWEASVKNAVSQGFVRAFKKSYPRLGDPNINQEGAWTMLGGLLRALKATHGDTSYAKLYPAFLHMRWQTPEGNACFSKSGMALASIYITKMAKSNGRYYWNAIKAYPHQADPHDRAKCA